MSIWLKYREEMAQVKNYLKTTAPHGDDSFFPYSDPAYKWEHTLMVLNSGLLLAKEERANIDVVALGAIFHDVCYYTASYEEHGHEGSKYATEYMRKKGYPNELIANVSYAVGVHIGEMNPKTIEAKIIQDADTLDKVGAVGVALILLNAGAGKLLFLDAINKYKTEYVKKLDFMVNSMWTKKARQIMAERTNFLTAYFKQLESELTS
ncbi:MAG: HD domain-containing protein [Promethearchaeati archaeon SRVP18_Atabeyarchaeia-1]